MAEDSNNNTEVFIYTEGVVVPDDVVHARIHPSVTVMPEQAFHYHKKLEEVELCDGLIEIGNRAFSKCTALKRVKIPSSVTALHGHAFFSCLELEVVDLCDGLLEIGDAAFYNCKSLKQITIPSTVVRIGRSAFRFAPVSIKQLPNSIENIGQYAFANNNKITNFRVPSRIVSTSKGMFSACKGMFSVEISENATEIESCTFGGCHSLRNVAFPTFAKVKWDAFWKW